MSITPNFQSHLYGLDVTKKSNIPIKSRRSHNELLRKGLFSREGFLRRNGMSAKEVKPLERVVFTEGSVFSSSHPIPGLQTLPVDMEISRSIDSAECNGSILRLSILMTSNTSSIHSFPSEEISSRSLTSGNYYYNSKRTKYRTYLFRF